jgi:DNA topoisomerase-1
MLFDTFDATDLNKELKQLMDGLSVKVFRTYNASITLDRLLAEMESTSNAITVEEKKADYDRANKEVGGSLRYGGSAP